jgi:hypothetical protein
MKAKKTYVVCDRLLDAETNEHCEFDGRVFLDDRSYWTCPGCGRRGFVSPESASAPSFANTEREN